MLIACCTKPTLQCVFRPPPLQCTPFSFSTHGPFPHGYAPSACPQQSFGDGPQKKALSRRFKSYSWIFTDALIDKLADLSAEDAARSRAIEGESNPTGPLLPKGEGGQSEGVLFLDREPNNMDASRAERERRWKERKRQRRKSKSVVMREMTAGCGSSKDLLVKVVGSWLPDVLAADRAAERRVNGGSA